MFPIDSCSYFMETKYISCLASLGILIITLNYCLFSRRLVSSSSLARGYRRCVVRGRSLIAAGKRWGWGVVYGTLYCKWWEGLPVGLPQCWVPRSFLLCWSLLERLLLVPRLDVRGQAASFPSGTRVPRTSLQHSVCERSLNPLQGTSLDELVNASARGPPLPPWGVPQHCGMDEGI